MDYVCVLHASIYTYATVIMGKCGLECSLVAFKYIYLHSLGKISKAIYIIILFNI